MQVYNSFLCSIFHHSKVPFTPKKEGLGDFIGQNEVLMDN